MTSVGGSREIIYMNGSLVHISGELLGVVGVVHVNDDVAGATPGLTQQAKALGLPLPSLVS